MSENTKPRRLFEFLGALTRLSMEHGIVIEGHPELEFRDNLDGGYAINPNNEGPEFGWKRRGA